MYFNVFSQFHPCIGLPVPLPFLSCQVSCPNPSEIPTGYRQLQVRKAKGVMDTTRNQNFAFVVFEQCILMIYNADCCECVCVYTHVFFLIAFRMPRGRCVLPFWPSDSICNMVRCSETSAGQISLVLNYSIVRTAWSCEMKYVPPKLILKSKQIIPLFNAHNQPKPFWLTRLLLGWGWLQRKTRRQVSGFVVLATMARQFAEMEIWVRLVIMPVVADSANFVFFCCLVCWIQTHLRLPDLGSTRFKLVGRKTYLIKVAAMKLDGWAFVV